MGISLPTRGRYYAGQSGLVSGVFGVHGNAGITQHGFRSGGGYYYVVFAVAGFGALGEGVAQVPHFAFDLAVLNFEVRDGGV